MDEEYISKYTGEQIDAAVGNAQDSILQSSIAQSTGTSLNKVMSQRATTDAIPKFQYDAETKTLTITTGV